MVRRHAPGTARRALVLLAFLPALASPAAAQVGAAVEAVKQHFRANAAAYGVTALDLADLSVTDAVADARTGATFVYLRQRANAIEVHNATAVAAVSRTGAIHGARARFVRNLALRANAPVPVLTAPMAVTAAAGALGLEVTRPLATLATSVPGWTSGVLLSDGGVSRRPIPVRLVYYATAAGPVRLAWDLALDHQTPAHEVGDGEIVPGETHYWSVRVDAQTGALLERGDWVAHDHWGAPPAGADLDLAPLAEAPPTLAAAGTYRVFPLPVESPAHGNQRLVSGAAHPVASPRGWHDTGAAAYTYTRGNNVFAYDDLDDDDVADPGSYPDGGPALTFDYRFDAGLDPNDQLPAAVTNLFYWNNLIHDVMYQYGFDEAGGNFQETNFSGAGFGGDPVQAQAVDGSGTNNANMATPPDAPPLAGAFAFVYGSPRMQMYRWTAAPKLRVTAPGRIRGTYAAGPADFGARLSVTTPLAGTVVLAESANHPDSTLGCTPLTNAAAMAGNIALIERGGCEFGRKALRAQQAGAIAAIIYNNARPDEEVVIPMGPGVDGAAVTIPAIHVARSTGLTMRQYLPGVTVELSALGQDRDSDFDNGVIVHEYGHGISNRLVGGPQNADCLLGTSIANPAGGVLEVGVVEQMGEGWSDYLGLMLTMKRNDSPTQPRGIGTYLLFQPNDGAGIRPARYSTDFAVNNYTYANLPDATITVPHGIGFIWATMLWEMTWEIMRSPGVTAFGDVYDAAGTAGNQIALNLVTTGMKLTPCAPGFVDGRDAILEADRLLYGGAHQAAIWRAFARRGLGYSASQGSSLSRADGTPAFDLPPSTPPLPGPLLTAGGAGVDRVEPAHPNPATDRATLAVEVARPQAVRVEVFDALGRRVALAHDGELAAEVRHEVTLDLSALAPGVYVWRVTAEDFAESGRLTVTR